MLLKKISLIIIAASSSVLAAPYGYVPPSNTPCPEGNVLPSNEQQPNYGYGMPQPTQGVEASTEQNTGQVPSPTPQYAPPSYGAPPQYAPPAYGAPPSYNTPVPSPPGPVPTPIQNVEPFNESLPPVPTPTPAQPCPVIDVQPNYAPPPVPTPIPTPVPTTPIQNVDHSTETRPPGYPQKPKCRARYPHPVQGVESFAQTAPVPTPTPSPPSGGYGSPTYVH